MKKNNWFNKKIEEVEKDLNTNLEKGLTTEEVKKLIDSFIYDISKLVSKDYNIRLVISPRLKADEHCGHGVFRIENSNLEYTYLGNINEAVKNIGAL